MTKTESIINNRRKGHTPKSTPYIRTHGQTTVDWRCLYWLKKAFDLVDHKCLLHKLEHYGVRGHGLGWFRNYLTTRSQRVQYGKELSSSLPLDHGVPQGSLLGPLLFVIHINDLPQCLLHSSISMYADDTVIYYSGSEVSNIRENLQEELNRVEQWLVQ